MPQNNTDSRWKYRAGPKRISMVKSTWDKVERNIADPSSCHSSPEREDVHNNEQTTSRSACNDWKPNKMWLLKKGILLISCGILLLAIRLIGLAFLLLPIFTMYQDFGVAYGAGNRTSFEMALKTANISHLPTPFELIGKKYDITGTILMKLQNRISSLRGISSTNSTADPGAWKQHNGEFCKGLDYFYKVHFEYAEKYERDWFDDQIYNLYGRKAFLLVLIAIFSLSYIASPLRMVPIIFSEPYHLLAPIMIYIQMPCIYYMISSAVATSIGAEEYAEGGIRCAICCFTAKCPDDNELYLLLYLLIPKLLDCWYIAGLTLWCILDLNTNSWRLICLKIFGWVIAAPLMTFTPTMAVLYYESGNYLGHFSIPLSVTATLFYIGVILWSAFLIPALIPYTRTKMKIILCSKN